MNKLFLICAICAICAICGQKNLFAETPANFRNENLIAWCIVPFDAKKRGPAERAQLVIDLGLKRVAYDWRAEHVPQFEEEILQYKKHGIEYFAFWGEHEDAFALFEKHGIHPQLWKTNPSPKDGTQEEKIAATAEQLLPLANRARELGCKLGLYNHGGWGGEPENLVAVCEELRRRGFKNVGIVYNFHHAHDHIARFAGAFALMKPYLLSLNINGMTGPEPVDAKTIKNKILPVGSGNHERAMIQAVIDSGYDGPIGILGHIAEQDVEKSLRDNLEGLAKILATQ
jgi:sugar phosphate isomerase/epimerase